jgi:hypothetical protein
MIRARSSLIWRSASRWAVTVWPTWLCCAPSRGVYGRVASDPTVSRAIAALAGDAPAVLKAIDTARAAARHQAWKLAADHAPDHGSDAKHPLVIDLDATLVTSHSDKEKAAPTFKRGYGFHPLCAFVDHGPDGTGEAFAILLRPGNAGSNTATDHITVVKAALAQLPGQRPGQRHGRKVLIRIDGAGGTKALIEWLTSQRLSYSVGFTLPVNTPDLLAKIPDSAWTSAYDAQDQVRDGAWVAELTGLLELGSWPVGMRVIVRKERPHPGAQLRFDDVDGMRITAFVTNTRRGQLPDLELRHRRRARCEDRIRIAKDRADQPAPARLRPEPDLVRHRDPGIRPARLDGDARPHQPRRPPLGAETAPTAPVHHPRQHRPHRTAGRLASVRPGPLGQRCRRRHQQTRPVTGPRLTRRPAVPTSRTTRTRGTRTP